MNLEDLHHKVDLIGIEIALIVSAGISSGIDVHQWLTGDKEVTIIPTEQFNASFTALGLEIGKDSWEAKREVTMATSPESLKTINVICTADGQQNMIDVAVFLCLCKMKVGSMFGEEESVSSEAEPPLEVDIPSPDRSRSPSLGSEKRITPRRCSSEPPTSRSQKNTSPVKHVAFFDTSVFEDTEKLLMKTVRKTDLYHLIQVHLGYVKPYILNLPRTRVVKSTPIEYVSLDKLHEAFCAARLHLSIAQMHCILHLVSLFAGDTLHLDVSQSLYSSQLSSVVKNKVNAEWLRKYLVYLRLQKKTQPWTSWLTNKLRYSIVKPRNEDEQMREFRRSLGGVEHTLSLADAETILKKYSILPDDALQKYIKNQVMRYVLDVSGRLDFQHDVNSEFKKWLREVLKAKSCSATREQTEKKRIRKQVIESFKKKLLKSEEKEASISIDLYKKYDKMCRDENYLNCPKFGVWLNDQVAADESYLADLKDAMKSFKSASVASLTTANWLTPLNLLEHVVTSTINNRVLLGDRKLEYRKKLVQLKKDSHPTTKGHVLISKRNFESSFDSSFCDIMVDAISNILAGLSLTSKKNQENCSLVDIFRKSSKEALSLAEKYATYVANLQNTAFDNWKQQKIDEQRKLQEENEKKSQAEIKEMKQRSTRASKAYKQWLKLRRSNKYYSKEDKTIRPLPQTELAMHDHRWVSESDNILREEREY